MKVGETIEFKEISNYYGILFLKRTEKYYYWGLENWDGVNEYPIPEYLAKALIRFHKSIKE